MAMATRKKVKNRPAPKYTAASCGLCSNLDSDDMVACDVCDEWYHFSCAGVTQDIKDEYWPCHKCRSPRVESVSSRGMKKSLPDSSTWSRTTMSSKQKQIALLKLEEEQALKMDYINRKYEILGCTDDGSDSETVNDRTFSVVLPSYPPENVPLKSLELQQDADPTSSDEERELCNQMYFNDSHRVALDTVRNSYEERRHSAVHTNIHPCANKGTFTLEATSIGQKTRVQQPPMDRQEIRQLVSKRSTDYNRQNCLSQMKYFDATQTKQPEMISKQTNPIIDFTKRVRLPQIDPLQQEVNRVPRIDQRRASDSVRMYTQQPQANLNSNFDTNFNQPNIPIDFQSNFLDDGQVPLRHVPTVNNESSGYVGFTGGLTPTHIAARHVFSKDLPQFWGKAEEWPMFLSALKNSTTACGFSDGENLGRLQRCLKGDAIEMVRCHLLHASSVPGVVETLYMMFGRPSMIIHSLLEKINDTPAPKADDLRSLIKFAISVQSLSATITSSGNLEYLRNPSLIQSITDKLPIQTRLNWASFKHGARDVDLAVMGNWLFQLAQMATEVVNPSSLRIADKKDRKNKNQQSESDSTTYVNAHSDDGDVKKFKCRGCNTDSKHALDSCKKFKELSVEERWNFIKKHKLCGSCFGFHKFYKCLKKKKCGVGGCTREHHILLHNAIDNSPPKPTSSQNVATLNAHRTVSSDKYPDIFRIVPVILSNNGKSVRIFAYLDDGSNLTSLEESVARKLNAVGTKEPLCVKWSFGNRETLPDSRQLTVKIRGIAEDAEEYILNHVRTVKKLMLPTQSITEDWLAQYSHFDDVPITTYTNATPQMIIGLEYSKLMVSLDTKEGNWSQPLVCKTRIGWVVQGPNGGDMNISQNQRYSLNMCECKSSDKNLHQLISDFFSAENLDVKTPDKVLESKDIARAKRILEKTISKKGNHYEVGLLWKRDDIELPNSYPMAKRRLECVETKMKKDPILAQRMRAYIQDFVKKGYIRKLSEQEKNRKGPRTWYLPIFPVFNPKKPEKLRVVWDGAAKVNGTSINSVLLTGPDLLEPLPDVLRRFREKEIAFIGDLKEMFHQIAVVEEDQDSQRFLWHDDPNDLERQPDEYILNVDSFGLRCSPATAQYVKNRNAENFKEEFPDATKAIIRGHYVDDMLENSHTVTEAAKLLRDVQYIHGHAGFEMRNFISNSKELLQLINGKTECGDKFLEKDSNEIERVLGMYWNTSKDTFTYSLKFIKSNYNSDDFKPTKREILRTVMSIFDPLGFLAHYVVHAKILLQEIWRIRIGWDDEIPTSIKGKWIEWLHQLTMVEEIHIPRLYSHRMSPQPANSIQLHMFVDAGNEAYATVAYFRVENDHGIDSCIVGAKSRVAPIKPMSVPRLELQGAVLGTRLAGNIIKSHYGLTINKTIIWCDSRTVLSWLRSDIRKYNQFVTYRVAEILESSCDMEWRWIPSAENVADEATKTKQKADLRSSARWFVGPEFLRYSDSDWRFELEEPEFETHEELRPVYSMSHLVVPCEEFIDFKRFSNWSRLVRAVTYVLRFVHNSKSKAEQRYSGPFSSEELIRGESLIYRKAQYDSFEDELVIIRHNETAPVDKQKEFNKNSVIRTCSAYFDENGVMRVMGRNDACTSISVSAKRPIILDRRHHVTNLIVNFYHKKYKHLNHQTVLNEVNQKYWIQNLRSVINTIRNNCQKCKNTSATPKIPEMAPLPPERLAVHTQPFTYTGVDYFGPILVVVGRSTQKRWGVLFTCMTSRAIHLEVAHSLNTSSCIMSVQNFIAQRGQPRKIHSDNGLNFHGANNELREEFKKLVQNRIQEEFTTTEMSWSFIPPKASHMGGVWERMIGIVKRCMDEVISIRHPTDEVLTNLMKLTMNIVNSRPLTYVCLDSPTDEVITPNHLLLGSSSGMKPLGDFTGADALKNCWKTAQVMADKFWRAFVLEYLPTLVKRPKWFKKVTPLKVDDVVLIVDENFKRNTWPKGIVVEIFKDKSGMVRSGRVRTGLGTFLTRPVSKLVVLDVRTKEERTMNDDEAHNDKQVNQIEIGSGNGGKYVVEQP